MWRVFLGRSSGVSFGNGEFQSGSTWAKRIIGDLPYDRARIEERAAANREDYAIDVGALVTLELHVLQRARTYRSEDVLDVLRFTIMV